MKIATYNVNGIRSREANLIEWLERESPDNRVPAGAQSRGTAASRSRPCAMRDMARSGSARNRGTALRSSPKASIPSKCGARCRAIRRTITRVTSEAAVDGLLVACIYLPNGNPQPGAEVRLQACVVRTAHQTRIGALRERTSGRDRGRLHVVPTDFDIYNPKSWLKDALLQPGDPRMLSAAACARLDRFDPLAASEERIYTFWDYFRQHWAAQLGASHRSSAAQCAAEETIAGGRRRHMGRGRPHASDHAADVDRAW